MKVGWQLTQIYVLNDGQEFWGQNSITKHNSIWNLTRQSDSWEFQLFKKLTCTNDYKLNSELYDYLHIMPSNM